MKNLRSTLAALLPAVFIILGTRTAFAQEEAAAGVCAPWHRCLAIGGFGLAILMILVFGAGYLYQRRGFDTVEHRQGSPDGVKVED